MNMDMEPPQRIWRREEGFWINFSQGKDGGAGVDLLVWFASDPLLFP
jgi:hypothetical protein